MRESTSLVDSKVNSSSCTPPSPKRKQITVRLKAPHIFNNKTPYQYQLVTHSACGRIHEFFKPPTLTSEHDSDQLMQSAKCHKLRTRSSLEARLAMKPKRLASLLQGRSTGRNFKTSWNNSPETSTSQTGPEQPKLFGKISA